MSENTDKITSALSKQELDLWRAGVDEKLKDHSDRLTHTDTVLDAINLHLARIDTNLQWFKSLTKWLLGLVTGGGGIAGLSHFLG